MKISKMQDNALGKNQIHCHINLEQDLVETLVQVELEIQIVAVNLRDLSENDLEVLVKKLFLR